MNAMPAPAVSAAFSGHRLHKIINSARTPKLIIGIRNEIYVAVDRLYQAGYRNFITGMAIGFDLWAGSAVMDMKTSRGYSGMTLTCAIPFPTQQQSYDIDSMKLYYDILDAADFHIVLSPNYHPRCFRIRNDWMLEHSTALICYYNGIKGGTAYTVNKARQAGHTVINLHDTVIG